MYGREHPMKLITPQEAIKLYNFATLAEVFTTKELFEVYGESGGEIPSCCIGIAGDDMFSLCKMFAFMYDVGRVQGMREVRATRKGRRI